MILGSSGLGASFWVFDVALCTGKGALAGKCRGKEAWLGPKREDGGGELLGCRRELAIKTDDERKGKGKPTMPKRNGRKGNKMGEGFWRRDGPSET